MWSKNNENSIMVNQLINFLDMSNKLSYFADSIGILIRQTEDKKFLKINFDEIDKVIERKDFDGSSFIQINLKNKNKMLITKNLIGFKPMEIVGFDAAKIPKVVTTLDLQSVIRAIDEILDAEDSEDGALEFDILRKVFQSIMLGAENIGIEMKEEKHWFSAYMLNNIAASA